MELDNGAYIRRLCLGLRGLRKSGQLCDTVLVTADRQLHAHSVVLAAASPVFRAAFESCASDGCMNYRLQLEGLDGLLMEAILECIYCGCETPLKSVSSELNTESILVICQQLGLSWLFSDPDCCQQRETGNVLTESSVNGVETSQWISGDDTASLPCALGTDLDSGQTLAPSATAMKTEVLSEDDRQCAYICDVCCQGFLLSIELRRHRRRHRHCATCYDCGLSFFSKDDLCHHSEMQCVRMMVMCNICGQSFHGWPSLSTHVLTTHSTSCLCLLCGQAFLTLDQLTAHMSTHTTKLYRCQICSHHFRTLHRLRKHIVGHVNNDRRVICGNKSVSEYQVNGVSECQLNQVVADAHYTNFCFDDDSKRNTGNVSVCECQPNKASKHPMCHPNEVNGNSNTSDELIGDLHSSECSQKECHKLFPDIAFLQTHKIPPVSCRAPSPNGRCVVLSLNQPNHSDVDLASKTSVADRKTAVSVENGRERVTCAKCLQSFKRLPDLHVHMRCHTEEMRYKCSVCGRLFRKSGTLSRHMRIHTGERPYVCETCGKSYKLLFHLRLHTTVHSTDRPFACDVCAKTFQTASSLKKHRFVHTGIKPFDCPICLRSFNRGSNMRAHMRVHDAGLIAASVFGQHVEHICILCRKTFGDSASLQVHLQTHAHQMELDVNRTLTSVVSPAAELSHCKVVTEQAADDVYVSLPNVQFDDFDVD